MRINFKPYALVLAVAVSAGIIAGTVRALASPAMNGQSQDQDYSKNRRYQQGMREGRNDQTRKRDHYKKRHFKKDEDNRAYESGYQRGHQGDQHVDQHVDQH